MKKANSNATSNILALLLAAVTLACTVPAVSASEVPFKGSANGAIAGAVPDSGVLVLTVLAEGNATHLGRFTREEVVLFNPATGILTGLIVFTAANGDQLFGTMAGRFISADTATGIYTFTGGTGRFANATGSADFVLSTLDGAQTLDGAHFSVEFKGTVSSVGSNKQ